jgi:uncharacterized protein (DUF1684 family)
MHLRTPSLAAVVLVATLAPAEEAGYRSDVERWRTQREERLKADGGWLTVTGLFWLKEGVNVFGSAPANDIVLPAGVPGRAGVFELRQGKVTVRLQPSVTAAVGGEPFVSRDMKSDKDGTPDVLTIARLSMHVIQRGQRFAVRLKDLDAAARREFTGLTWFPVSESYRIKARFVPYAPPRPLSVPNILGEIEEMRSPGYAVFMLEGKEVRLEPVLESAGAQELFFIFRDQTAGKETYPAGRFLYSSLPRDGSVVLDFNKAYNPPCAFTAYSTCPMPPLGNRLDLAITAGEMKPRKPVEGVVQ